LDGVNQLITKYIYLFAITSLMYPIFMLFSSFAVNKNLSNLFISFLVANILFLAVPHLIKTKSSGIWEKILNIAFIIIIPQGFSLFVLKPYGLVEMLIGQLFCTGLYVFSYMTYDKKEINITPGGIFAGLWLIIVLALFSSFINVPKDIINQYTTYSIIFLTASIYLSNRINLENLLSRSYRKLNIVSSSLCFINLFMSLSFILIMLVLFRFKGLAPIIVDAILYTIRFFIGVIKKILDFINSLFATKSTKVPTSSDINEFLKTLKPQKKSLIARILDVIAYILASAVIIYILYKLMGILRVAIKEFFGKILEFLQSRLQNFSTYERGENYTDVKTFIFTKSKQQKKPKLTYAKRLNLSKKLDINTRLRLIFKYTMEYFYIKK